MSNSGVHGRLSGSFRFGPLALPSSSVERKILYHPRSSSAIFLFGTRITLDKLFPTMCVCVFVNALVDVKPPRGLHSACVLDKNGAGRWTARRNISRQKGGEAKGKSFFFFFFFFFWRVHLLLLVIRMKLTYTRFELCKPCGFSKGWTFGTTRVFWKNVACGAFSSSLISMKEFCFSSAMF